MAAVLVIIIMCCKFFIADQSSEARATCTSVGRRRPHTLWPLSAAARSSDATHQPLTPDAPPAPAASDEAAEKEREGMFHKSSNPLLNIIISIASFWQTGVLSVLAIAR